MLYRDGRYDEALKELTRLDRMNESHAEANTSTRDTSYFLAMTHHALGQNDEASAALVRANEWTDRILQSEQDPPSWDRRLTLGLLRREADQVLRTKPKTRLSVEGSEAGQPPTE